MCFFKNYIIGMKYILRIFVLNSKSIVIVKIIVIVFIFLMVLRLR